MGTVLAVVGVGDAGGVVLAIGVSMAGFGGSLGGLTGAALAGGAAAVDVLVSDVLVSGVPEFGSALGAGVV